MTYLKTAGLISNCSSFGSNDMDGWTFFLVLSTKLV